MSNLSYSIAWLLGYRAVPFAARRNFRFELRHVIWWSLLWGSVNGHLCGYIAIKSLGASDWIASAIVAAMPFANLFTVWWSTMMDRVGHVRAMTTVLVLNTALLLSTVATPWMDGIEPAWLPRWLIAVAGPRAPLASLVFTVQIIGCWILVMGANTIRTSAWKHNYPAAHRGRVMARFAVWQMFIGSIWAAFIGMYLDGRVTWPAWLGGATWTLHWLPLAGERYAVAGIFPVAAACCAISALHYRQLRMRRRGPAPEPVPTITSAETDYSIPAWLFARLGSWRTDLKGSVDVLRRDRAFLAYQGLVFIGGSAVMLLAVPFLDILRSSFGAGYFEAAGLLMFGPQCMVLLTTPLWAHLFDRWPLLQFRTVQMSLWAISRTVLAVAVLWRSVPLLWIAVLISGLALAGGRIAWQIGHMAFSRHDNDRLYQAIHQTLTGVRGLIMPLLGMVLYRYAVGEHIVWITAVLLVIACCGYGVMHRRTAGAAAIRTA